jgi:hypothetical protein
MGANQVINELKSTRLQLAYMDACNAFSKAVHLFADKLISCELFAEITDAKFIATKNFKRAN